MERYRGWRIDESLMRPLTAERRGEMQDHVRLHLLRTIVVLLVVAVVI